MKMKKVIIGFKKIYYNFKKMYDTSIKLTLFLVAIIISSMNIDERDAVMHI